MKFPVLLTFLLLLSAASIGRAEENARGEEARETEADERASAAAEPSVRPAGHGFALGGGFFFHNLMKVAGSGSGGRSFLGDIYFPELTAGYRFGRWYPLVGFTPFGNRSGEGNKRRGTLRIQMPYVFSRDEGSALEWRAGLGLLLHRIYGDGGYTVLGNGTGSRSYYTPAGTIITRQFYVVGGASLLEERIRYEADFMVAGLFSTRRAFSLSLGAAYVF